MYSFDNNSTLDKYSTIQEDVFDMYNYVEDVEDEEPALDFFNDSDIEEEQLDWDDVEDSMFF
ncbi:hypothetical protein EB001_16095 [bacterium]|nr:hypothetical protein [bacterium]